MAKQTQLTIFKHKIWMEMFYGCEADGMKRDG